MGGPLPDDVVVRVGESAPLRERLVAVEAALDPRIHARWERLKRPVDREDFLAARFLAADALRELLNTGDDVVFEQCCVMCGGPHGRPRVTSHEAVVTWAHAGGVVAAAAAISGSIGVDVERIAADQEVPDLGLPGRAFVRAEALVKATSLSLDQALRLDLSWPWGQVGVVAAVRIVDFDAPALRAIGALARAASSELGERTES